MQRRVPSAYLRFEPDQSCWILLEPSLCHVREPQGRVGTAAAAADCRM
jgi:hypothetical protein